jgi:hypothetical protein
MRLVIGIALSLVFTGFSPVKAADFSDTTPPVVSIEEVRGVSPSLNVLLFKIQAEDNANKVFLRDCGSGLIAPNCRSEISSAFLSVLPNPPDNIAPACATPSMRQRTLGGFLVGSSNQSPSNTNTAKYASTFYVLVTKTSFEKVPEGCPKWRNENLQSFPKDSRYSRLVVVDEAGNSTEVPILSSLQATSTLPNSTGGICFVDSNTSSLARGLSSLSDQYNRLVSRFGTLPQFNEAVKKSMIGKFEEELKFASAYSNFYQQTFDLNQLNALPSCSSSPFQGNTSTAVLAADLAASVADLSAVLSEALAKENEKKAEAEAKAKAEAEAKAKAEAEAKAKAPKRSSITCTKGKSTLKVSGKKPKCPAGYKRK